MHSSRLLVAAVVVACATLLPRPSHAQDDWRRPAGYGALAGGAVSFGFTVYCAWQMRQTEAELARLDDQVRAGVTTEGWVETKQRVDQLNAEGERWELGWFLSAGIGAAAVATGVTFIVWELLDEPAPEGGGDWPVMLYAAPGRLAAEVRW